MAAAVCAAAALHTLAPPVLALQMENLDARDWHVLSVTVEGNQAFSDYTLGAEVLTRPRPWYTPWRPHPIFDPGTLEQDLVRLRRFYEARGYFDARVLYDIEASEVGTGDLVAITFWIEEGEPSTVGSVDVAMHGPENLALPESLSVKTGERFDEEAYQKADADLKQFFLENGYAHVETKREAEVDAPAHRVKVRYTITPGPETHFGDVNVEGADQVGPDIVLEDLEWKRGERFSIAKINESREELLKTHLFQSVRIGWDSNGRPIEVPILVQVGEKDHREVKLGVGYATDEKYRVQARWDDWNFFGGGRQMSVALKYSSIESSLAAMFTQPHFLSQHTSGVVEAKTARDDEDNYVLYAQQLNPRLEHKFSSALSGSLGYRLEADDLSNVAAATVEALGGVKRRLILSGPAFGLLWNTSDSPFDPHAGEVVSLQSIVAGLGDFRFWKADVEGKKYTSLPWDLVLANRLRIAFADAFGSEQNLPIFERLYAGGARSVRGYGRRRLGPRDSSNNPIGGLSAIEGSAELRHPIWDGIAGAVFLDFGQVTTRRFDIPVDDLKFATGFGLSYVTPVGPLRLDVGFPFERPPGDAGWQVYFSIGQFF